MQTSLLGKSYLSEEEWRELLELFSAEAIALKLLLAQIPFVFKDEPVKYALFRQMVAEACNVEPSNVFIVGSAMAGRSLKAKQIDKEFSSKSDIDTLIVSEHLFASYVMQSLEWFDSIAHIHYPDNNPSVKLDIEDGLVGIARLSQHASRGIWRPDSLPKDASVRQEFFGRFAHISLTTLGLRLSDGLLARKVSGRIARSFDDAHKDLSRSIYGLGNDLRRTQKSDDAKEAQP